MTLIRHLAQAAVAAGLTLALTPAALADHGVASDIATQHHDHGHDNAGSHDHGAANDGHAHGHDAADDAKTDGHMAADIAMALEPEQPTAGDRATLTFTVRDAAGEPLEELLTHHGRKLHVVIVGEDMAVLGHIHPADFDEPIEGSRSQVFFTFPRPGRYLIAADIMTEAGPHAEQFPVEVAGEAKEQHAGSAAAPKVAVVEAEEGDRYTAPVVLDAADQAQGYEVSLARPHRVVAGESATFTFRVARGGAPVTDLRPYLDAALHLAVVKQDFGAFLHEHGTAGGAAANGGHPSHGHGDGPEGQAHGSHGHGTHGYDGPAQFGPEMTATLAFPEPGRYTLFGQAAHGDKLLIARFPIEVE
ncbi:MAG TPA: hypothetical protein VHG92_13530 [Afifellaceae bacterium]|nr:hypothetical protein [Afifellaceae bacterium]